ncbi:PhoD-like phosphatase-domain-containing protein [Cercophora scortea]|uniref:PhoD-like phosphatase-domain-containing protein n=1 Tax=Cercophora scortea TaxID=314031 RepID=A0AAE0IMV7_9PEZI|nr:PhoD-like phosphatase-domain-containing protein [Cercophora scortea]
MASTQTQIANASSIAIRSLSYFFLRWALAPFIPALVFTLFAIYVPTFVSGYRNDPKYDLVDEVDVVVTETKVQDTPNAAAQGRKLPPAARSSDDSYAENYEVVFDHTNPEGQAVGEGVTAGNGGLAPKPTNENGEVVREDIDVVETISVEKRPLGFWKTLLTGAPNSRSLLLSAAGFLINALLVGFVADRLFTERYYTAKDLSFVRPGYVARDQAKLLIREPDQSKMPVTVEVRIKDPQAPFDSPLWMSAGGVRWTSNLTDYTAALTIPLKHSKQRTYEWKTSNNHSGEFTTPPSVGQHAEADDRPFTFIATSCIVSRLPYSPFDHPLAIPGLKHLAKVLPALRPQFLLFLGDFIYADVPRWWGKTTEDYRQKYRQIYASPDWPAVGQNLSWIHVLDDHEIQNDWSEGKTGVYHAAIDPFKHYHAAANPPEAVPRHPVSTSRPATSYFAFTQGPASFFMLDTRSYRSPNRLPADAADKTMLGPDQLHDLLQFLRKPEPRGVKWKIIASSVPFTKNWGVNTQDTWGGFLAERKTILETMWDAGANGYGVVILSGDRHEFAATKFPPPVGSKWPQNVAPHEFSASPLSQFYAPVGTYHQQDDEDVEIKYIYRGNSKFGAISIENLEDGEQSSLKYRLFVDGKEVWDMMVLTPPAPQAERGTGFFDRFRFGKKEELGLFKDSKVID